MARRGRVDTLGALRSARVTGGDDRYQIPHWWDSYLPDKPDWLGGWSGPGDVGGSGAWGDGDGGSGVHPASPRDISAAKMAYRRAMIAAYRAKLPRTSATRALVQDAFTGPGRPDFTARQALDMIRAARRGQLPLGGNTDIPGVGSAAEVALYGLQRNYAGVRDGTMTRRQARRLDRRGA